MRDLESLTGADVGQEPSGLPGTPAAGFDVAAGAGVTAGAGVAAGMGVTAGAGVAAGAGVVTGDGALLPVAGASAAWTVPNPLKDRTRTVMSNPWTGDFICFKDMRVTSVVSQ